jgi:hypothetical protein
VDPKEAEVDFVEFTFKDEFISRADMWRFKNASYGRCAYIGRYTLCAVPDTLHLLPPLSRHSI